MKGRLVGTVCAVAVCTAAVMTLGLSLRRGTVPPDQHWWQNASELAPANATDDDYFGRSVALDGETALLGAPGTRTNDPGTGAAYTFQLAEGEPGSATPIGVTDALPLSGFGFSVALCGGRALVGSPADRGSGDDSGAAYLYQNVAGGQWNRVARFVASDAAGGDQFGNGVALGSDIALVGTRRKPHSGVVYCFREGPSGTWREAGKLAPDAETEEDSFGWPLTIHEDLAAVGAYQDSIQEACGAVFLFQRRGTTSWKQVAKLTAPENKAHPTFGRSIAVWDEAVLAGAPGYANGQAAAFLFRRNHAGTWSMVAQLAPADAVPVTSFGHAVAMSNGTIAVGAPLENEAAGAVYLFQLDDQGIPQQVGKITLPGKPPDRWFGAALAMRGDKLLVGAHQGGGKRPQSGAAYLFRLADLRKFSRVSALKCKR